MLLIIEIKFLTAKAKKSSQLTLPTVSYFCMTFTAIYMPAHFLASAQNAAAAAAAAAAA
jgi:hypothetical protein